MNITNDRPITVFKNEYQGRTFYKLGLSRKDMNGQYINGYIQCRFKKDVDVPNKTKIKFKGFIDFYLKDKQTIPYIFVTEYVEVQDKTQTSVFEDFGNEIEINDNFLE